MARSPSPGHPARLAPPRAADRMDADGRSGMALRVGVVGGGQLARMMIAPAVELGVEIRVLAEDEGMSAALAATAVGDYRDTATVLAFARDVDVITFDPRARAAGRAGRPGRRRFAVHPWTRTPRRRSGQARHAREDGRAGLPQPDWAAVSAASELQDFLDAHGGRARREDAPGRIRRQGRAGRVGRDRSRRLVRRPRRGRQRRLAAGRGARRFHARTRPAGGTSSLGRGCAPTPWSRPCSATACAPRS